LDCDFIKSKSSKINCEPYGDNIFFKISSNQVKNYPYLIVPKSSMFFFEAKILSFVEDVDKIYLTTEFDTQEDYYKQEGK